MKQPENKSRRFFLQASSMLGLGVAFSPAMVGETFAGSKPDTAQAENSMAQSGATPGAGNTAIRPFHKNFPATDITELRRRVSADEVA